MNLRHHKTFVPFFFVTFQSKIHVNSTRYPIIIIINFSILLLYVLYFQAVTAKNAAIALKIVAIGQFTL